MNHSLRLLSQLQVLASCFFAISLASAAPLEAPSSRKVPLPLPDHPGNVFVEGETVQVPAPANLSAAPTHWRLLDDGHQTRLAGVLPSTNSNSQQTLNLGTLGIGWYRVEFGGSNTFDLAWTSLAVLRCLRTPVPLQSPVAVDSAVAWFARDDAPQQARLANLAALAGAGFVRDRLRWREIQPEPGNLTAHPTTYDTSADAHREAGLPLLQVFHDTPSWARSGGTGGGQFSPDLRHVYELGKKLASRFKGIVAAWEPWNEANVASFGGHTVDQMCSWQKAAWLGFKSADSNVIVGWNATAAVPTVQHTEGVLANETWPYFDTYNIHTYDWSHSYATLWAPARDAASGRPIWVTEADRGTPHLKNAPWYDQDPRLERLKAEWIGQAYASSLFAGAQRHFHFILGNYQEPNGVQFGLLRLDLTPRPAYAALAAVGRCLAGARILGRWQPEPNVHVHAFRGQPDGEERDVLVIWTEKEADWADRGQATATWKLPSRLRVLEIVDYLGRSRGSTFPAPLTSAPVFALLPPGEASQLPLESPPALAPYRTGQPSTVVLQMSLSPSAVRKVEDLPWSEGYAYKTAPGRPLPFEIHTYNFAPRNLSGNLRVERHPKGWELALPRTQFDLAPMARERLTGTLTVPASTAVPDGWVVLRADCNTPGSPVLAFRILVGE